MPTGAPQNVSKPVAKFKCEYCEDNQVIRYNVPMSDYRFGRLFPCPKCNQAGITARSGLLPKERDLSLAVLDVEDRPGTAQMVTAASELLKKRAGMLALCGQYGTGKSTLMKAIVAETLKAGHEARYMTMTELLNYAREAFDSAKTGDSDVGRISEIARIPVVCIDECDKPRLTEYAREIQTHFFDVRYRGADTLMTVAAWNGKANSLDLPWAVSRFSEFGIVENWDADMRPLLGGA